MVCASRILTLAVALPAIAAFDLELGRALSDDAISHEEQDDLARDLALSDDAISDEERDDLARDLALSDDATADVQGDANLRVTGLERGRFFSHGLQRACAIRRRNAGSCPAATSQW